MPHRIFSAFRSLPLALALALTGWAPAALRAEDPAVQSPAVQSSEAAQASWQDDLAQGERLERDRKWAEALTHYEEALKRFPDNADLAHRLQLSRMHYDLGRRFADASYRQMLAKMSSREALDLYAEVLLKLQSHYVETPDFKRLVNMGTTSLEVALIDPTFLGRYAGDIPVRQINSFRGELRDRIARTPVRNRHEARDAVNYAARLGQRRLGVPPSAIVLEYVCGAANTLDDYSAWLTSGELSEVYAQIEGNFVGLGIELKAEEEGLSILRVIPGSPAEKGGIRPGDTIVAVEDQPTREMNSDEAADLLQGPEGTTVRVDVVTPGAAARTITIRREHIDVPSVDDLKMLDDASGIAYMRLAAFQKTTSGDLDAALWQLHRAGMKSLVIDLRGNPGGLLTAAVEAADKFISQGVIVSTRGRSPGEDFTYRAHQSGTWRVPLVVLIDGDSASASEIFAGAIRDHARGDIVGMRSYGKGSVQGIFSLKSASTGIRLTTAKFYSPQGHPFSKVGVKPNVEVRQAAKPAGDKIAATGDSDAYIQAAVDVARQRLAARAANPGATRLGTAR